MNPSWITFYSVRGGVGRSTLLGLCALDLARRGRRVVVIDFDLESPGLDILLTPPDAREEDQVTRGVVDYLAAHASGQPVSLEDICLPRELPGDYMGRLFLLAAGRCDDSYLAALDKLDIRRFYERSGLFNPIRALRADVETLFEPDVVLVDSRTGYSDTALSTLFDLADAVVSVLVPDLQNVERLAPVLKRLVRSPKKPTLFLVANKCYSTPVAQRAVADIEDKLRGVVPRREEDDTWDEEERPFLHKLRFDSSYLSMQKLLPPSALADTQRTLFDEIALLIEERRQAVTAGEPVDLVIPPPNDERKRMLASLSFAPQGDEAADYAEKDAGLLKAFFFAPRVLEALKPDRPLVRGRKGAGKSAIFRLLTEEPGNAAQHCSELTGLRILAAHGEQRNADPRRSFLRAEDFRVVAQLVKEDIAQWKDFWRLYAVAQIVRAVPELETNVPSHRARGQAADLLKSQPIDRPSALKKLLAGSQHLWVQTLHELIQHESIRLLLVYDYLDAGFGSATQDFGVRRDAVTGLLDAWSADAEQLGASIRPKILLREDIFASLALANVNRWRTRDVELRWDFDDLAACLSKRARLDPGVASYLDEHAPSLYSPSISKEVAEFIVLFDERVRPREKQARTWLTARNRLSDALDNRFPRDFLRLGAEALELERKSPTAKRYYEPALIAGAHTLAAIPKVSERRAGDLKDEFPDYVPLLDSMRGLYSPFAADQLVQRFVAAWPGDRSELEKKDQSHSAVKRLKEYGVIGDWEIESSTPRLFVPDLYLRGLGMNRAGW